MNNCLNKACKQVGNGQKPATVYLSDREYPKRRQRKVWLEGMEVAIKVKGSQGKRRVEWLKSEHP